MKNYSISFESHGALSLPEEVTDSIWLERALDDLQVHSADLMFVFCSDEELLAINQDALNHDYYTDVITFDLTDEYSDTQIEADIYISLERVSENAKTLGQLFQSELRRVMIHGVLHLLGHTDKDEESKNEMRSIESRLINL